LDALRALDSLDAVRALDAVGTLTRALATTLPVSAYRAVCSNRTSSPAPELPRQLDAGAPVGTAVGQADEDVRCHGDRSCDPEGDHAVQLEGIRAARNRTTPVEQRADRDGRREPVAGADARAGSVVEILTGRTTHDRVARVAVDEEWSEALVPLETETPVHLA